MRNFLLATIVIFSLAPAAMAESTIGFRQIKLPDDAGARALNVSLWYPAIPSGTTEVVGENAAFTALRFNRALPFRPVPALSFCSRTGLAEAGAI